MSRPVRGQWAQSAATGSALEREAAALSSQSYDAYIRAGQRSTSPRDPTAFRVTLIGPKDCGKTCIVRRIFTAATAQYVSRTEPTIAEEGYQVDLNSQPITVIDLSGNEDFLDNIHENLQHTDLLLAVIDASQPMSSISLMARMLRKLIEMQATRPDQTALAGLCTWLIINKCDLTSTEWEATMSDPSAKERLVYIREKVKTSRYREFSICCHGNDSLARLSAERLRDAVVSHHTVWVYNNRSLAMQPRSAPGSAATSTNTTPRTNLSRSNSTSHAGSSTGALAAMSSPDLTTESPLTSAGRTTSPRSPTHSPSNSGKFSPGANAGCALQ